VQGMQSRYCIICIVGLSIIHSTSVFSLMVVVSRVHKIQQLRKCCPPISKLHSRYRVGWRNDNIGFLLQGRFM
jgi:hypothetical protein